MGGQLLAFAYGSNLSVAQVERRCPGAATVGIGVLRDHRLAFTRWSPAWEGGVADVVPAAGQDVWGLLWSLTGPDLEALDAYEGHPHNYRRSLRTVESLDAGPHDAWVYEVVDKRPFVPPAPDYLELMLATAAELELPADHLDGIRRAATDSTRFRD